MEEVQITIQQDNERERERRLYPWIEKGAKINMWDYLDKNVEIALQFERAENIIEWQELAGKMNLSFTEIENCRLYNGGSPMRAVFWMMKEKHKHRDLTVKHLLLALRDLNQHNILRKLPWEQTLDRMTSTDGIMVVGGIKCADSFFLNIHHHSEVLVQGSNEGFTPAPDPDRGLNQPSVKRPHQRFLDIMIVFAQDAQEDAKRVRGELHNLEVKKRRVRVLQVTGSGRAVPPQIGADPNNYIAAWFNMVDFVVPVLSPRLLRQFQANDEGERDDDQYQKRNRLLYRTLQDQFVDNYSLNKCCRPLCPPQYNQEVKQNMLVRGNGLLSYSFDCSTQQQVKEFAKMLVREKRSNANMR